MYTHAGKAYSTLLTATLSGCITGCITVGPAVPPLNNKLCVLQPTELSTLRRLVKDQAEESLRLVQYCKEESETILSQHASVVQRLEKYDALKEHNRQLYNQVSAALGLEELN